MTGSPQPTDVERAAIKEGYRALIRAKSPTSHLVELVVFGLSEAGMLQSPESAAHLERLTKDRDAFRDQRNGVFKTNERLLEELQEEQVARLRAENETRTVTRSLNAVTSRVDRAEQRRAELEAVLGSHRDGDRKEIERLRARVAVLESERAERNIVLNDVQVEAKALRERIAQLEATAPAETGALFEQARETGKLQVKVEQGRATAASALELLAGGQYGALRTALEGMAGGVSRAEAIPAARDMRPVEDPHDGPLHHAYRVARDLDVSVSRFMPKRDALCVCGHTGLDHHHAGFACWAHLPRGPRASMAEPLPPVEICGCKVFTAAGPGEQL